MNSKRSFFLFAHFKNSSLLICLAALLFLSTYATAQVTGDFKSKASGNWGDFTTWQVYNGATWVDAIAGQIPGGTNESDANNVFLEAGFTVTLQSNHSCKNLNFNVTADVVRINTQDNKLDIWGKLRTYNGTAPGANDNANAGIAGWISTGSTTGLTPGRLVFRGTADRTIVATGEYSAHANNMGYNVDFAFDAGRTATIAESIRLGYATIVSGTVAVGPNYSLRTAGDGAPIAGWILVKSGATLRGGQFFKSTTNGMLAFTLESGAVLDFQNTGNPILAAQNLTLNGTVILSGSTFSFPTLFGKTGAQINTFNNLTLSGTGNKNLINNVTVNGTLTLGGTTAALNVATYALSYGVNGTLAYEGLAAQTTTNAEFPVANGPHHVNVNNTNGVNLHAARTIPGTLSLVNGLFRLGNFDLTLDQNATIAGTASTTNMIVTNGTGSLRKIFSAPGSFFFPLGETTGTTEYSYAQISVNSADALNASTYVGLRVVDADHPTAASAADRISRYWSVSTNMTNINYDGIFQYLPATDLVGTESSIKTYSYSNETPLASGTPYNLVNAITHRIVITGLTASGFATGANLCSISNNTVATPSLTNFCSTTGTLASFDGSAALVTSATPIYQWQLSVNGGSFADVAVNGQSEDYSEPNALTAGVYKYRRLVSDPASCLGSETNTSNEITISVTADISNNSIGNNQTVISGNTAADLTSTATLAGGDGSYTYQWQESSVSGGPYVDVASGGTSSLYSPGVVSSDKYYVRKVESGLCATSQSNEVAVLVKVCNNTNNTLATPSTTEFCAVSGSLPDLDGTAASVTSTIPVYQWQESIDGSPFSDILSNGQNEDYTIPSSLTPGVYKYKRIVSDPLSCPVGNVSTSNEITFTVVTGITGNTIGSNQTIDEGDAADVLLNSGTLSGGDGNYTYQWQSSANSGGPYTDVAANGASADYDPLSPLTTIYFVRVVESTVCSSTSNEVAITVIPLATSIDDAKNSLGISLFPNPFVSSLNIGMSQYTGDDVTISIHNSMGVKIYSSSVQEGSKDLAIDLSSQASGIYIANFIKNNKVVASSKIVKQ